MKKLLALLCALSLIFACGTALAKTVKPMKSEMSIKDLSDLYFNGELGEYNAKKGTIKVTLYEREPFDPEKIGSLKTGDTVVIGKKNVKIKTFDPSDGAVVINKDTDGTTYYMYYDDYGYGNYMVMNDNDRIIMRSLGKKTVKIADDFTFADSVDAASGEPLDSPVEYTFDEFLEIRKTEEEEDGIGFNYDNTVLWFDGDGNLEVVERRYVHD